jgi:hypothetical protein
MSYTHHPVVTITILLVSFSLQRRLLLLHGRICLVPVSAAPRHRVCARICISLLDLPPPLNLRALRLGSPAATPRIIVLPVLVAHLPAALPASKLAAIAVTEVEVAPDNTLVKLGAGDVAAGGERLGVRVKLDEAESAGCPERMALCYQGERGGKEQHDGPCIAIQTHDDSFHAAAIFKTGAF